VREAIASMFDFAWTNKNLFYGMYKRNISFFGNSELASSGLPTAAELKYLEPLRGKIPDEVFTTEFKPPESDGTGNVRELARRALSLLKDAGWEIKDGKMVEVKTGKKLAFEMMLSDASFERVVLPYKQNLERFKQGESVHARHILIGVPADASAADRSKARQTALSVVGQLKRGARFEDMARKLSTDTGSEAAIKTIAIRGRSCSVQ
jgi:ABC-type oligopeptide transport system substrate-binding subunit